MVRLPNAPIRPKKRIDVRPSALNYEDTSRRLLTCRSNENPRTILLSFINEQCPRQHANARIVHRIASVFLPTLLRERDRADRTNGQLIRLARWTAVYHRRSDKVNRRDLHKGCFCDASES